MSSSPASMPSRTTGVTRSSRWVMGWRGADPSVAAGDQNGLAFNGHHCCLLGWSAVGLWRMGEHPPVQLAEPGKVVACRRKISGDGSAREDARQSEHGEQPGIEKSMDSENAPVGTLKHLDAERLQFS